MHPHAEIVREILTILGVLAWIGFGSWLAYKNRNAGCGIKILLAMVFTKGLILFWIAYGGYILVKNFREGMKEGQAEKNEVKNGKEKSS